MSNYRNRRNYENLERRIFGGVGEYGIPQIQLTPYEGGCDWIGFNYAKTCKEPTGKGVHFFLDDYQFNRLWTDIDRYIPMLQKFRYVMSPDFSESYADIQPLPETLGRCISSRSWNIGYPNNFMEYAGQL